VDLITDERLFYVFETQTLHSLGKKNNKLHCLVILRDNSLVCMRFEVKTSGLKEVMLIFGFSNLEISLLKERIVNEKQTL